MLNNLKEVSSMKNELLQDYIYGKLIGIIKLLLVLMVVSNLAIVGGFLWYLGLPVEDYVTTTYTQDAGTSGDDSFITQEISG